MTVRVDRLPTPYIDISLEAGGDLTVGQEYFFIGFYMAGYGYYANAVSGASKEVSIIPTAGMQSIKTTNYSRWSNITSITDAGSGYVTVHVENTEGLINGEDVIIKGTGSYDGTYATSSTGATSFNINTPYVGDDTGVGLYVLGKDADIPASRYGITYKWDKYSMLKPDGSYYRWHNLNDPAYTSEYNSTAGHRKWTHGYYYQADIESSRIYTTERTSYASYSLNDGKIVGSLVTGQLRHPQVAQRIANYPCYDEFNHEKGRLLITTDTEGTSRDSLIAALEASEHQDMYILSNKYTNRSNVKTLFLNAHFQNKTAGYDFEIEDMAITLLGGQFDHGGATARFTRSFFTTIGIQSSSWNNDKNDYIDSQSNHLGSAYIMDNVTANNSGFQGVMTWYAAKPSGFNITGGYTGAPAYFQWRYQRTTHLNSVMTDFNIKNYYIYLSNNGKTDSTGIMDNVKFTNADFGTGYDVSVHWGYQDGDANYTMECKDVSVDRNGGQLNILGTSKVTTPWAWTDTWNFRYGINITIVDKNGDAIEGADVSLSWDTGSDNSTTDVDGRAEVTGLSYTAYNDNSDGVTVSSYYDVSDFKELRLSISKAGYQSYVVDNLTIDEGKNWVIKLSDGDGTKNVLYNSTIYNSIIK